MSLAIQVDNVWKQYRLGQIGRGTLQRDLESWWAGVRGKEDPNFRYSHGGTGGRKASRIQNGNEFWALRGASFEVRSGEVVGIIGRNGAGKSTLLKILSRVTAPSRGEIRVRGRIASLLEIGTGFHPDLSGRENIFLNGAILGMRKQEIARKLDSIVDFSGCADFIDTPVKRYSSGMQVRLAFAVAAHLDAEILVIDEVLAVGDADFQKKCLGKMNEVAGSGRTVLFVSHNMGMITSLCQRAIVLEEGTVALDDTPSQAVLRYYSKTSGDTQADGFSAGGKDIGDGKASFLRARLEGSNGEPVTDIDLREPVKIKIWYQLHEAMTPPPFPNIHVNNEAGQCVFVTHGHDEKLITSKPGVYSAECVLPGKLLNSGTYFFGIALTHRHNGIQTAFFEKDALCLNVIEPVDETLDKHRCGWAGSMYGLVRPWLDWRFDRQL